MSNQNTETMERTADTPLPSSDVLDAKSWRCFHCDEIFTDRKSAEEHFGASVVCAPMCQIFGITVRNMETELARYRGEDTDLHRQINHLQCEHTQALMRAEESGYAKGLRDGRALASNVGTQRQIPAPETP